jgi:MarR family transcriptional regulator, lower aerobic nicotinate degradation pathway regulator
MATKHTTKRQPPTAAERRLVDALVQLSFAVQTVLTDVGARHDLSLTQVRLLGILRDRTVGMAEVARYLGLDKSSVTGLVRRAEGRGLVVRTPSPDDGRVVLVGVTSAARDLIADVEREVHRRLLVLTDMLPPAASSQLTALVDRVIGPV